MIGELKSYLKKITGEEWALERASDARFGDFASNIAFKLAKKYGQAPLQVAEKLVKEIKEKDADGVFEKVEAMAPGFVNFGVSKKIFLEHLGKIASEDLAMTEGGQGGGKINLEFVSANPTGPLTMANGRGGFLGDVLGNVLEAVGYDVTREYYINDAGVQIKKLGASILAALGLVPKSDDHYQGAYVAELAVKLKAQIAKKYQSEIAASQTPRNDKIFEEVGRLAAKELLARIKKSIKSVGIKYDKWFSEYKDLRKKKALKKTLDLLREKGMVYEKDGAVWLRTSKQESIKTQKQGEIAASSQTPPRNDGREDDKDRVLVKSDGEATYFLADLAYHYNKFIERKFDKAVVIWGADHHGYVGRVRAGIAAMGIASERFQAIIVQLIRLVRGGEEVKMSKRKGEFITLDDLVKEVGKDAARFFFLLHTPASHMDFDLDLAKEKSVKNPVYYLQYAAVRAGSILKKAGSKNKALAAKAIISPLTESEIRLVKELAQLPDIIFETASDLEISRLTRYAGELARCFHNFYEKERVIEDGKVILPRLALIVAAKQIFEKLFKILGISIPKKM